MAASTVTVTPTFTDDTQHCVSVYGTVAISASPGTYTTGGLAVSFNGVGIPNVSNPNTAIIPASVSIQSQGGSGYVYSYNAASQKIQVFQTGNATTGVPLGELAAAATPAGVSGDTIAFFAEFKRG